MKTQRALAILWLAAFIVMMCYWLWEFLYKWAPAYDGIHARHSLLCLFGIVACIFLFQGAKWARISLGIVALYIGVGVLFKEILPQGWMRVDKFGDDAIFVLSLVTVVLLFSVNMSRSSDKSPRVFVGNEQKLCKSHGPAFDPLRMASLEEVAS